MVRTNHNAASVVNVMHLGVQLGSVNNALAGLGPPYMTLKEEMGVSTLFIVSEARRAQTARHSTIGRTEISDTRSLSTLGCQHPLGSTWRRYTTQRRTIRYPTSIC